jgi:2Fe-2S ferredoxin
MSNSIRFTVVDKNSKQDIETYESEYWNLMDLLRDKLYLDGFGECGGMGRCATCIIEVIGISGNSVIKERNEPVTLSKIRYNDENVRLSCQLFVTKDLNGVEIKIFEL